MKIKKALKVTGVVLAAGLSFTVTGCTSLLAVGVIGMTLDPDYPEPEPVAVVEVEEAEETPEPEEPVAVEEPSEPSPAPEPAPVPEPTEEPEPVKEETPEPEPAPAVTSYARGDKDPARCEEAPDLAITQIENSLDLNTGLDPDFFLATVTSSGMVKDAEDEVWYVAVDIRDYNDDLLGYAVYGFDNPDGSGIPVTVEYESLGLSPRVPTAWADSPMANDEWVEYYDNDETLVALDCMHGII